MNMMEQYFGCECSCLNHISHMSYFPPEKDEGEEWNIIHFSVKTNYLYKNIIPNLSLNPNYWIGDLEYYLRFHILRRIPIALCSIFTPYYNRKHGVLDCFDFKDSDLPEIKKFLSNLSSLETLVGERSSLTLDNDRWAIKFYIWQIDEDFPYWFGWNIQFRSRKILGRIGYALKYIFGKVEDEQYFEITKDCAADLNGLITATERLNNERTESKN